MAVAKTVNNESRRLCRFAARIGKRRLHTLLALDMVVVRRRLLHWQGFKDGEFLTWLPGS